MAEEKPSKRPYTIAFKVPPSISDRTDKHNLDIILSSQDELKVVLVAGQLLTVLADLGMNKPTMEIVP